MFTDDVGEVEAVGEAATAAAVGGGGLGREVDAAGWLRRPGAGGGRKSLLPTSTSESPNTYIAGTVCRPTPSPAADEVAEAAATTTAATRSHPAAAAAVLHLLSPAMADRSNQLSYQRSDGPELID